MRQNETGITGTILTMIFSFISYLDKGVVAFALTSIVAILTIIYYILKIYNEFLTAKKNKQDGNNN